MTDRRPLVAGNWKMNGLQAATEQLEALWSLLKKAPPACDVVVCPPATLVSRAAEWADPRFFTIGGQDCHAQVSGAHTGDVSAEMLADAEARWAIVGHSERRADHGETDAQVRDKAAAAHRAGLTAIVCVGETLDQREAGRTLEVVGGQLAGSLPDGVTAANTVVAYEPVWAIGTGRVAETSDIAQVHAALRAALVARLGDDGRKVRLLYGGSVKPANMAAIAAVPDVDGALVGGASLKAEDFNGVIDAYRR